jgi:parallel beta-helix repeat protein
MSTSAYTRIPVIILAALALAACPGKKVKKHDDDPAVYYVSASDGSDTNPGTRNSKFKRLTHAMSKATRSGTTVYVAPGTYSSGEIFPIIVPAGVLLIGDEDNKGGGTSIVGGGRAPGSDPGDVSVAVLPGTGSTIAGFTVTNNNGSFATRHGLILGNSTVTLRNNTVTGATHQVGVYIGASTNHVITGNRIVDNGGSSAGSGLAFSKGGVGSKVENNVITGNAFGVEYDVAGGDLGGGSAGSAGGNVISCNTQNDLVSFAPTAITITAASNSWDHLPPTRGASAGDDIYDSSGMATVNAIPALLAPSPCAPAASPMFFVNASSMGPDAGSDENPGTRALPFKTITFAMTQATSGATVQVLPGIYDTRNNQETFPIEVPAGVLLIGDEASKGVGTSIYGGGLAPGSAAGVALLPGTGSTIAGFTITNDEPFASRRGVMLGSDSVTLRNNTVSGAVHAFGVYVDASTNHVIRGNRIVGNGGTGAGEGLAFIGGGAGSKVENNVITHNGFGIEYEVAGVDLGGGSAGSVGGNTISCNGFVDLYVGAAISVSAANNFWDHSPPTLGCTGSEDICNDVGGATFDTSNATQASSPCL